MSFSSRITKKTVLLPALATLLFIYGVTGIQAAKSNAQRHRDADTGGEGLSLVNESRRRHGQEGRVGGSGSTIGELASEAKSQLLGGPKGKDSEDGGEKVGTVRTGRSETEERLRELQGRGRRGREG